MLQDISLDILGPEKHQLYRGVSSEDPKSHSSIIKRSVDHVTPDNLTRKLQLHKKTELSDFFEIKQDETTSMLHSYSVCDACEQFPIVGVRYRCTVCNDYDLCGLCKQLGEHSEHEMIEIAEFIPLHRGICCDNCGENPISGVRYKCTVCPDYDLCSNCRQDKHHGEHHMKEMTVVETQQLLKSLMIDPPRQIEFDDDFELFGKLGVRVPFSKRRVLMRLQALIRQDMSREIEDLLKGFISQENGQYCVLNVDLDGILKTRFRIPIYVLQKHGVINSKVDKTKSWLLLTAIQLAIVTRSSNALQTLLKHMLTPTKNDGREKSEEEIMNFVISAIADKVELTLTNDSNVNFTSQYIKRDHISLHGMNSFHLAAKYNPEAIQTIHQIVKNGIWELIVQKNIPETSITMLEIHDGSGNYRRETATIGQNVDLQPINHIDMDAIDGYIESRNELFDHEETSIINIISNKITEEKFARHDPFYVLKFQNESFKKCLIQLQLLLRRNNCLFKTPLHVAVEKECDDSCCAVEYLLANCPESVDDIDIKGHTPLHIAVKMSNEHFVKMLLLDGNAKTGVKGHRLKISLHYAKLPSIVKILMENLSDKMDPYCKMYIKDNENIIKCGSEGRFVQFSNLIECSCQKHEESEERKESEKCNDEKRSVFSSLLLHNDQAAVALLDEHVNLIGTSVDSRDALIVYDITLFQKETSNEDTSKLLVNPSNTNEFKAHLNMIKTKSKTFEHPLSTVFVDLQHQCFNVYLPWILLRPILLISSLTGLILWQGHILSKSPISSTSNSSDDNSTKSAWHYFNNHLNISNDTTLQPTGSFSGSVAIFLFGMVCLSVLLILQREITEACRNIKGYCKDIKNCIEIGLITSTITYLIGIFYLDVHALQHASAWSIFFAWVELVIILTRVPRFGMYIIIFYNVSKKLLGYFMLFMPGLLAFSFAFYSLPSVKDSAFHGVTSSITKIIIMMTGEIGFEDYFEWNKTKEHKAEWSSQIFLVLFIVFISIALVNLLLGLAVNELEKERKVAKNLYNLIAVDEINSFWQNFNSDLFLILIRKFWDWFDDNEEKKIRKRPTYLEKLAKHNGLFKSIRYQWLRTGLAESDFSWKLCIDPNQRLNDEKINGMKARKNDEFEVFFFNDRRKCRFRSKLEQDGTECNENSFLKTDFALSEKIVTETVSWLRQKQNSSDEGKIELAEKHSKWKPLMEHVSQNASFFKYHQQYQQRYDKLMKELSLKYLEFTNKSENEEND